MRFHYWRMWEQDGRPYGQRVATDDVTDARRRHGLASGWSWVLPNMAAASVSPLYADEHGRQVEIAGAVWQHPPVATERPLP